MSEAAPRKTSAQDARLARSAARLAAVQALYRMEMTGAGLQSVLLEFRDRWLGAELEGARYRDADPDAFKALLEAAVTHQARIDKLSDAAIDARWSLSRIDPTLRALFRAAGAELLTGKAPPRVVISEFVDVAKAFFDEGREAKFVNAVLDHMARHARPEAFGG